MIQAVFNDPNLKQNLDNYAEGLSGFVGFS